VSRKVEEIVHNSNIHFVIESSKTLKNVYRHCDVVCFDSKRRICGIFGTGAHSIYSFVYSAVVQLSCVELLIQC